MDTSKILAQKGEPEIRSTNMAVVWEANKIFPSADAAEKWLYDNDFEVDCEIVKTRYYRDGDKIHIIDTSADKLSTASMAGYTERMALAVANKLRTNGRP